MSYILLACVPYRRSRARHFHFRQCACAAPHLAKPRSRLAPGQCLPSIVFRPIRNTERSAPLSVNPPISSRAPAGLNTQTAAKAADILFGRSGTEAPDSRQLPFGLSGTLPPCPQIWSSVYQEHPPAKPRQSLSLFQERPSRIPRQTLSAFQEQAPTTPAKSFSAFQEHAPQSRAYPIGLSGTSRGNSRNTFSAYQERPSAHREQRDGRTGTNRRTIRNAPAAFQERTLLKPRTHRALSAY